MHKPVHMPAMDTAVILPASGPSSCSTSPRIRAQSSGIAGMTVLVRVSTLMAAAGEPVHEVGRGHDQEQREDDVRR